MAQSIADPTVRLGSATISGVGTTNVQITQNSDKAVIDWRAFSVDAGSSVTFSQLNANSIALNRITGAAETRIDGSLLANGQVWLLNPNGVLIGGTGRVSAGGFLATTNALSNEDFAAGNYTFDGTGAAGAVSNMGQIVSATGGYAVLAGDKVGNSGLVQAHLGEVVLGAGKGFVLDLAGDKLLSFAVTQPLGVTPTSGSLVTNTGTLSAAGGQVLLTARAAADVVGGVINTGGLIEATSVSVKNGQIVFDGGSVGTVTVGGTVNASGTGVGETGGLVQVAGETVVVGAGAQVSATGDAGGGSIYVGGGWQGALINGRASSVRAGLASTATLDASATGTGNGGTVVLWSDVNNAQSQTLAAGSIFARGGVNGGDGGWIETSGHYLNTSGVRGSAAAAIGSAGLWLFDPYNVTISGGASSGGAFTGATTQTWMPTTTSNIMASDINGFLNGGTNVRVTTGATGDSGGDQGNISVDAAITKNAGGSTTLTLDAVNAISVTTNGSITASGTGTLGVFFNAGGAAGGGVTLDGAVSTNGGGFTITTPGAVTQGTGGAFTAGALSLNGAGGTYTLNLANSFSTLMGTAGAISVSDTTAVSVGSVTTTTGGLSVVSGGALTVDDNVLLAAGSTSTLQSTGVGINGNVTVNATIRKSPSATASTLELIASNRVSVASAIGSSAGGVFNTTIMAGAGGIGLNAAVNTTGGVLTLNTTGTSTQNTRFTTDTLTLLGAGGTHQLSVNSNDFATLTGDTGSITLFNNAATTTFGTSTATVKTTGNLQYNGAGNLSLGGVLAGFGVTVGGALILTTPGLVTQTSAFSAASLDLRGGASYMLNLANSFASLAGTTGSISLTNSLAMATSIGQVTTTTGELSLTSAGNMTLDGALTVATALSFNTGATVSQGTAFTASLLSLNGTGGTYSLDNTGNSFTSLTADTGTINLAKSGATTTGIVKTANGIQLASAGNLSINGALTFGASSALSSGNNITVSSAISKSSGTATLELNALNGITLGNSITSASGALGVMLTAGSGGIGVNAAVNTSSGNLTLSASGAVISNSSGMLTGAMTSISGSAVTVGASVTTTGMTSLTANTGAITLNAGVTTSNNALTLTSTGTVSQNATGGFSAGGLTLQGGGTFALGTATNSFTSLATGTGGTTSINLLKGNSATTFGAISTGAFTFTTGGLVTQSGGLTATSANLLGTGGNYDLTGSGNNMVGTLTSTGPGTASISLTNSGTLVTRVGMVTTTGGLNVTSGGNLTVDGAVQVGAGSTSRLESTGGDVTVNVNATVRKASGTASSALQLIASNAVNVNAAINSIGTGVFDTSIMAGVGGIALGAAVNTNSGTLTLDTSGNSSQTVAFMTSTLTLNGMGAHELLVSGNAFSTLTGNTGSIDLANGGTTASTIGMVTTLGALKVKSGGALTVSNAVSFGGVSSLESTGGNVAINAAVSRTGMNPASLTLIANASSRSVSINSGGSIGPATGAAMFDVVLNAGSGGISIGGSGIDTKGGALSLTTAGNVTQGAAFKAAAVTLNGGNFALASANNEFTSLTTGAGSASSIALKNVGSTTLGLGPVTTTGTGGLNVNTTASGLSVVDAVTTTGRALTLTASGAVSSGATGTLSGAATSISGSSIRLDAAVTTTGSNTLTLTSTGTVTQGAAPGAAFTTTGLSLNGTATGAYRLTNAANSFTTLTGTTGSIELVNGGSTATSVGAVTTSGALDVTSGGTLTVGGAVSFGGVSSLKSTGGNVVVNAAITRTGMDLASLALRSVTGAVTINAAIAASLTTPTAFDTTIVAGSTGISLGGAVDTQGGALTLTTTGTASQMAKFTAGALTLNGVGGTYNLGTQDNVFTSLTTGVAGSAGSIDLKNTGTTAVTVNAVTTTGLSGFKLNTTASGLSVAGAVTTMGNALTLSAFGALTTSGLGTLTAGTTTLSGNGITIGADVTTTGATMLSAGAGTIALDAAVNASANALTLTTTGTASQMAKFTAGALTLNGVGGTYNLGTQDNVFTSLTTGVAGSAGSIDLKNTGTTAVTVNAVTTTGLSGFKLNTTASGLSVAGAVTTMGNALTLSAFGALTTSGLGTLTAGTTTLSGNGITIGADVTTTGATMLSAGAGTIALDAAVNASANALTLTTTGTASQMAKFTAGALTLNGVGGTYNLGTQDNVFTSLTTGVAGSAGSIDLKNTGTTAVTVNAVTTTGLSGFKLNTTASGLSVAGAVTTMGNALTLSAFGALTTSGLGTLTAGTTTLSGNGITIGADVTTTGATMLSAGAGTIALDAAVNASANALTLTTTGTASQMAKFTAGALTLNGVGGTYNLGTQDNVFTSLTTGVAGSAGSIDLKNTGTTAVTVNAVTTTGLSGFKLNTTASGLSVAGAVTTMGNALTLSAFGALTTSGLGTLTAGTTTLSGNGITIGADVTTTGATMLSAGAGTIALDAAVNASANALTLTTTGTASQMAKFTAGALTLNGVGGTYNLGTQDNVFTSLTTGVAGSAGSIDLKNTGTTAVTVNAVTTTGLSGFKLNTTASGLSVAGAVTTMGNALTLSAFGALTTSGLGTLTAGTTTLSGNGITIGADVTTTGATMLSAGAGTIALDAAVNASANALTLTTTGTASQMAKFTAGALTLNGVGGTYNLGTQDNVFTSLTTGVAGSAGSIDLKNTGTTAVTVNAVTTTGLSGFKLNTTASGLSVAGAVTTMGNALTLSAFGALTTSGLGTLTAGTTTLSGNGITIGADVTTTGATMLSAGAGTIALDAAVNASANALTLTTTGTASQMAKFTAGALTLNGVGGTYNLGTQDNVFTSLTTGVAGSAGSIDLKNTGTTAVTVNAVTTTGLSGFKLNTTASGLSVAGAVTTMGNALTLSAFGALTTSGLGTLTAGTTTLSGNGITIGADVTTTGATMLSAGAGTIALDAAVNASANALTLTTTGTASQMAKFTAGALTLNGVGGTYNLGTQDNVFTSLTTGVAGSAGSIDLKNTGTTAVTVNAVTTTGLSGFKLNTTASGLSVAGAVTTMGNALTLSAFGALTTSGLGTLTAGTTTLSGNGITIGADVTTTGATMLSAGAGTIALDAAVNASANALTLTTTGTASQMAKFTAGALTLNGVGGTYNLGTQDNVFTSLTTGVAGSAGSIDLKNTGTTAVTVNAVTTTGLSGFKLNTTASGLSVAGAVTTMGNALTLSAFGALTTSGLGTLTAGTTTLSGNGITIGADVTTTGATMLSAGAGTIALDAAVNASANALTLTTTGTASQMAKFTAGALTLNGVGGTYNLGTQDNVFTSLTTGVAGSAGSIDLKNTGTTAVTVNAVTTTGLSGFKLNTTASGLSVAGAVTTMGNALTLSAFGALTTSGLGTLTAGTTTLSGNGITIGADVTTTGATMLSAGAGTIALDAAVNASANALTLTTTGTASQMAKFTAGALTLNGVGGTYNLGTQDNVFTSLTTGVAGSAGSIDLKNTGTTAVTVNAVTTTGLSGFKLNTTASGLSVAGAVTTMGNALTLSAFGALTTSGLGTLTAGTTTLSGNGITIGADVTTTGATMLSAGAGTIALDAAVNASANALTLTTTGTASQMAKFTAGALTLNGVGGTYNLGTQDNVFTSLTTGVAGSAGSIDLKNTGTTAVTVNAVTTTGLSGFKLNTTASGLSVAGAVTTMGNALTLSAFGALTTSGLGTLTAGTTTLSGNGITIGADVTTTGATMLSAGAGTIALDAAVNASANALTLTTTGTASQMAKFTAGALTLNGVGGTYNLGTQDNVFTSLTTGVAGSAGSIDLKNTGTTAVTVNAVTTTGLSGFKLNTTASGLSVAGAVTTMGNALTLSAFGALTTSGLGTLTAGTTTLSGNGITIGADVTTTGATMLSAGAGTIALDAAVNASANALTLTTTGTASQMAKFTAGALTLNGVGGTYNLGTQDNVFTSLTTGVAGSAGSIDLKNTGTTAVTVNAVTTTGLSGFKLNTTASGLSVAGAVTTMGNALTLSAFGALTTSGLGTLTAGTTTLSGNGITIGADVTTTGATMLSAGAGTIALDAAVNASANALTLTTTGTASQMAKFTAGALTLNGVGGTYNLGTQDNVFTSLTTGVAGSAGSIDLKNTGTTAVTVNAVTTTGLSGFKLNTTASGLSVAGAVTTMGNALTLSAFGALTTSGLGTLTAGTTTLSGNGITIGADVTTTGATMLSAGAGTIALDAAVNASANALTLTTTGTASQMAKFTAGALTLNGVGGTYNLGTQDNVFTSLTTGVAGSAGSIDLKNTGTTAVTVNAVTTTGLSGFKLNTTASGLSVAGAVTTMGNALTLSAFGALTTSGLGTLTAGTTTLSGNGITIGADVTTTGATMLSAGAGTIALDAAVNASANALTLTTTGTASQMAKFTAGALTLNGVGGTYNLGTQDNVFTSLTTGVAGSAGSIDLKNTGTTAVTVNAVTTTGLSGFKLNTTASGLSVAGAVTTMGNALTLSAFGALTTSGLGTLTAGTTTLSGNGITIGADVTTTGATMLSAGAGTIALDAAVNASANALTLTTTGTASQMAKFTAGALTLNGVGGTYNLGTQDNVFTSLTTGVAGSAGSIDLKNTGTTAVTVNAVTTTGLSGFKLNTTASGLSVAGAVTTMGNALTLSAFGALTTSGLGTLTAGTTTLSGNGITIGADVTTTGATMLSAGAGTIALDAAVNASANALTLTTTGTASQMAKFTAGALTLNGVGGTYNLGTQDNVFTSLTTGVAGSAGSIDLKNTGTTAVTVNAVTTTGLSGFKLNTTASGLSVAGAVTTMGNALTLSAFGALTTSGLGTLTAGTTTLSGNGITIGADVTTTGATMLSAGAGTIALDAAVNASANALTLTTTGTASQMAKFTAGALTLNGVGGTYNLGTQDNVFTSLTTGVAGSAGSIDLKNTGTTAVTVNAVTTTGLSGFKLNTTASGLSVAGAVTTMGNALTLSAFGALTTSGLGTLTAGTTTLSGNGITIGADVTTTGVSQLTAASTVTIASTGTINAGADISLVAGTNFINQSGADAIATSNGARWLIYSQTPANNSFDGLVSGNLAIWGTVAPASSTITGNRYIFATTPTVTITAANARKTYGDVLDANSVRGFTNSGIVDAALYGNVFTQDVLTGTPGFTSAGDVARASVLGGPYNITVSQGSLALTGYAFSFVNGAAGGKLTIDPKQLAPSLAGTVLKIYDGNTTATLSAPNYALSGIVAGDEALVSLNNPTTGIYDSKNAGVRTVTVNGVALIGDAATNYFIASPTISGLVGQIDRKALTASLQGNVTKTYDGNVSATLGGGNYLLSGVVGNETVLLNNPVSGVYDNRNVGTAKVVTVGGLAISGIDSSNYTVNTSANAAIGRIDPKAVSATLTGTVSKIYDGSTTATLSVGNYVLTGIVANDAAVLNNPTTGSYDTKNAGTGKTVTVGGIALTGADAGNYTVNASTNAAIGQIDAKAVAATLTGTVAKTYDATTTATLGVGNYVLTGIVANDAAVLNNPTTGSYDTKNVGTAKTVTVGGIALTGADAGNYTVNASTNAAIGQIDAKAVAATLTGTVAKTYDATTTATLGVGNYVLTGIVANDAAVLNNPTTGSYDTKNVGTAKTVTVGGIALTGADAGNYTVNASTNAAIGQIDAKAVAATLTGTVAKTYDATTTATLGAGNYVLTGIVANDAAVLNNPTTGSYDTKNAGTGKTVTVGGIALTGADAGNYTVNASTNAAIGQIDAKAVAATLTGTVAKTYDATTTATLGVGNYVLTGIVANDAAVLNNPTTGSYDTKNVGTAKTVTVGGIALTGADAGNYTVNASTNAAIGQIDAKAVAATLTGTVAKTYDATTTATLGAGNYVLTGIVANDAAVLNNPTTGSYDTKNAGTGKTVTVGGIALTGADAGNYTINTTANAAIGRIDPKAVAATLTGTVSKIYDGSTTATLGVGNYVLTGIVANDAAVLNNPTTGSFDTKNVGTAKTVTVGGIALTGADAGNYTVNASTNAAIGQIDAKAVAATLTGTVAKTYDATTTATLGAGNYVLTGIVANDAAVLNNPTTGSYDTKNAGTGKTVTVGGIALTGADAGNYTINTTANAAIGRIDPKAVAATLTGTVSKIYDGSTTATLGVGNYVLTGIVANDAAVLNNPTTGSFDTKNVGTAKTVTVGGIALTGADAGNYTVNASTNAAIGQIDAKAVAATLTGTVAKTYDATTTATLGAGNYVLTGIVANDAAVLNNPTTGSYDTKNAGTGKTVTVGGIALTGADAGNYTINTSATAAIGRIDPRAVAATLVGTVTKTYDAATTATLGAANYTLTGILANDAAVLNNPATGSFDTKNVGTAKTVTVGGIALTGADAGNYTVNTSASAAIGRIDVRAITATLTGSVVKVFDGTTTATLGAGNYSLTGTIAGDAVLLNNPVTGSYDTAAEGTAKTVSVGGIALTGADAGNYAVNSSASAAIGRIDPVPVATPVVTNIVSTVVATITVTPPPPPPPAPPPAAPDAAPEAAPAPAAPVSAPTSTTATSGPAPVPEAPSSGGGNGSGNGSSPPPAGGAPVEASPPSPVPADKPPTPKDAADAGDPVLASVDGPSGNSPAPNVTRQTSDSTPIAGGLLSKQRPLPPHSSEVPGLDQGFSGSGNIL